MGLICLQKMLKGVSMKQKIQHCSAGSFIDRASDFCQDWWAEMTPGAKNGRSFSEMMGPSISN